MELKQALSEKRETILRRWYDLIVESYPPETAHFLKSGNNEFTNPVGQAIREGISGLLDSIIQGGPDTTVTPYLDRIIRVRAVQDFAPSDAVAFVFGLKKIIREIIMEKSGDGLSVEELFAVEERIDGIAGVAFNIFMECREKLYELKANELRSWTYRLLERVNEGFEVQDKD